MGKFWRKDYQQYSLSPSPTLSKANTESNDDKEFKVHNDLSRQKSTELFLGDIIKVEDKSNCDINIKSPNSKLLSMTKPLFAYIGNCTAFESCLETKSGKAWLLIKFIDAMLRGISQVVFANNPFTGLIILFALFWSDVIVGLATVHSASVAIITAFLIKQDITSIKAGLTTYSGVLVGSVTASLWTPIYNESLSLKLWLAITIGTILSVFLTSATSNILSSFKIPLPCLTMPFNIVNLLLFTCLMPQVPLVVLNSNVTDSTTNMTAATTDNILNATTYNNLLTGNAVHQASILDQIQPNVTEDTNVTTLNNNMKNDFLQETPRIQIIDGVTGDESLLDYGQIFTGIICSVGQIYGVENFIASLLMCVGILIYSPLLCLMGLVGATVGTITGILFTPGPLYTTVYTGIWGYNAVLSASAIGGFFIAFNYLSFTSAIINVFLTAFLQQGLIIAFHSLRLPVFTLPFVISTLFLLSVTSVGDQLTRVTNITFPEMHAYNYLQKNKNKPTISISSENNLQEVVVVKEKELDLIDVEVETPK